MPGYTLGFGVAGFSLGAGDVMSCADSHCGDIAADTTGARPGQQIMIATAVPNLRDLGDG